MSGPAITDRRVAVPRLVAILGQWRRPGRTYEALADGIRSALIAGTLPPGTRVPSERELAAGLGVSRTTTTAAYSALREDGYLASRHGSGTVTRLPSTGAPGARSPVRAQRTRADRASGQRPWATEPVDLSIAAPAAPPGLAAACAVALDMLPRYFDSPGYAPPGLPELRSAVARRYTERGTPTAPEQILVTSGAQQAIALLIALHAGPGDRVVVEQPTYPHAIEAVRAAGARPVPVPSGPEGTDLDLLESTIRQVAPRLVYLIPDHRNPTGTSLDAAGRARVRGMARRYGTVVVGDETLAELTLDGPPPQPWPGDGRAGGVVAVGSASKVFWGGLRIGWVRGPAELITRLAHARHPMDISTPVLEQLVVAELLRAPQETFEWRRSALRAGRDLLLDRLAAALPGWTTDVPRGGQSLWVDLGAPVSSALSALALAHGVLVAPGPTFGVDTTLENRLRLPFTAPPAELERAVQGLAEAWSALDVSAPAPASSALRVVV